MENTTTNNQTTTVANSTPATMPVSEFNKKQLILPISIIIAGALIAFGLYTSGNKGTSKVDSKNLINGAMAEPAIEVAKVTDADHIRGNKDAKIVIIEYSDIECPFCKIYHETMKKIYAEYSKDNQVAWVYRHFPLSYGDRVLHKNAAKEAEATECAAELGGKEVFWSYLDELYATTKSNDGLDMSILPSLGKKFGLDEAKMKACIDSGKYAAKVKESFEEGAKAGAAGTPYTVIQFKGENIPLVDEQGNGLGALPHDVMKRIVDNILSSK
jgi:protein-disulfide isomerase